MKNKTKVVHLKNDTYDVLIANPSKWKNPFTNGTRCDRIKKYEKWILTQKHLMSSLDELEGKILGCWCKPKPCHGDVLVSIIEKRRQEKRNTIFFHKKEQK